MLDQIKSVEHMIEFARKAGNIDKKFAAEQKANENVDVTQNANWYDASGIKASIQDMTTSRGHLLSRLSGGFEGSELPVNYPLPYDTTNYFMKGKTPWVSNALPTPDAQQMTDAKNTLSQKEFIIQFQITDAMLKHSTDKKIFDHIVTSASKSAVSTIEGCIVNGDTVTAGTGNVNSDDQAPATTFGSAEYHSLKIDNGLRKLAIANSNTVDISAFDSDDIISVINTLGTQYKGKFSDLAILSEPSSYLKMQTDDSLKLAINTANAAIDKGANNSPWSIDLLPHDLVPLTEADGRMAGVTPANNTKGQFVIAYLPAIRWGFGSQFNLEVRRIEGYGFQITGTMEFAFTVLDGANTSAAGINMTV